MIELEEYVRRAMHAYLAERGAENADEKTEEHLAAGIAQFKTALAAGRNPLTRRMDALAELKTWAASIEI